MPLFAEFGWRISWIWRHRARRVSRQGLYVSGDFRSGGGRAAFRCEPGRRSLRAGIYAHVSIAAQPPFEGRGYKMARVRGAKRDGLFLKNYPVEKFALRRQARIAAGLLHWVHGARQPLNGIAVLAEGEMRRLPRNGPRSSPFPVNLTKAGFPWQVLLIVFCGGFHAVFRGTYLGKFLY